MREKVSNSLVPRPDYMVDALKLPNQAPRVSGEPLYRRVWSGVVLNENNTSSVGFLTTNHVGERNCVADKLFSGVEVGAFLGFWGCFIIPAFPIHCYLAL
ncbi:hypothetical protein TNCV_4603481 [Trichonephila clavipes]|nr:hypothetical protein TNCV_4603481 [Trichonephila clavipes]